MNRSLARRRVAGVVCVAAVTTLALSACGSGGSSSQATGSRTASAAKRLAALLPARIAKSGTLVVGVESAGSTALESMSGSSIVGFDPDLIKAIGAELGVTVQVQPAAFDSLVAGVQSARYDVALGGMGDTKAREQSVSFVDYLNVGVGLLAKKGNPAHVKGPSDLCGRPVAVVTGGYPQTALVPKLSAACTKAGKSAIRAQSFSDTSTAVLAVQSGRVACLYNNAAASAYLLKTATDQFEVVGPSQTVTRAGIAFSRTDSKLGNAIEAALQELMKSGMYAKIAKRWNLTTSTIAKASINDALA